MVTLKRLLVLAAGAALILVLFNAVRAVTGQPPLGMEAFAWELAVIVVMGCSLIYPVGRSRAHGPRLLLAVFVLAAGVNAGLVLFEMLVFTEPGSVGGLLFWWICRAAGLSLVLVVALGRWRSGNDSSAVTSPPRYGVSGWLWRVAVSVLCYTALFMVAGLLIMQLEAVPDYTSPEYADAVEVGGQESSEPAAKAGVVKVPELPVIFGFIWTRGLACIVLALPLLRGLSGGRWTAGLSIGIALAVLGGVAPLLAPNDEMTTAARLGHMLEISWSNLAYGLVLGYFFGNRASQ
jgi:hypothetical protein